MKYLFNLVCFLSIIHFSCSQQKVIVGEKYGVTNDNGTYAVSDISVNPNNPEHMVSVAMRFEDLKEGQIRYNVTPFISHDSGKTWKESLLPAIEGQQTSFGASVMYAASGRVYIAYTANIPSKRRGIIAIYGSDDNGENWDPPTVINTQMNQLPKLMIDENEDVYFTTYGSARDSLLNIDNPSRRFALILGKSTDKGKTFDMQGMQLDNDKFLGAFKLVKFSNGDLWFPFAQFILGDSTAHSFIYGTSVFEDEIKVAEIDQVAEVTRYNTYMVNTAVDRSDHYKDRIYVAFSVGPKDSLQTAITYSIDKGKTWSQPNVLTIPSKGHFARLPNVAVNENGMVGITWVQIEGDQSECWNIYFSHSKDGGETFSDPVALSSELSCPNTEHIRSLGNGMMYRYYAYGGDYTGLSPLKDGFQASWVDLSNNSFQLYTTKIKIDD